MVTTRTARRSAAVLAALAAVALAAWAVHRHQAPGRWVADWTPVRAFHFPRRALAAASDGRHLYAIGGVGADGHYVNQVEYAAIRADGTLGEWRATAALGTGRFYLAAVYLDGYLYALGGGTGPLGSDNTPTAAVERARVLPDGRLGRWTQEPYMNFPRRGLKAVAYRRHIYAIGGYDGRFLRSTERADLDARGHITAWHTEPEQSVLERYIHSAARWGRRIYLLGGHVHSPVQIDYGDVESARIGTGGALAPWAVAASSLQVPRFVASAFALRGYLYIAGGHNETQRLSSVEYARIHRDGTLAAWRFGPPLHQARSATAVAVAGRRVYVLGGMGDGILDSVEMATQGPGGLLGRTAGPGDP